MNIDFSAFLMYGTLGTGIIWCVDKWFWKPKRLALLAQGTEVSPASGQIEDKEPIVIEYARSFFPVLLFVFLLRSFVVEPFRIPSGSMIPTLQVGDFILVNKFTYGIRIPVFNQAITTPHQPQRGDVIVFRGTVNPSVYLIKRVIGLPGDVLTYRNKELLINGKIMAKELKGTEVYFDESGNRTTVRGWFEDLGTVTHSVYEKFVPGREAIDIKVPQGHFFMMGDNRDDSDDSRSWGFVPQENIVGKAFAVWFSWDFDKMRVRYETIPRKII